MSREKLQRLLIDELRSELGYSVVELASIVGEVPRKIWDIAAGTRGVRPELKVRFDFLFQMLEVLNEDTANSAPETVLDDKGAQEIKERIAQLEFRLMALESRLLSIAFNLEKRSPKTDLENHARILEALNAPPDMVATTKSLGAMRKLGGPKKKSRKPEEKLIYEALIAGKKAELSYLKENFEKMKPKSGK